MLKEISVSNLAIIEDINLDFSAGFTVLTGQTGAGKSLVIDSIGLILGARADSDLIRYGENEAIIRALFDDLNSNVKDFLEEINVPSSNLEIERRINLNNKNTIKVNGKIITLQDLKKLGLLLGDIHVQHDTYRLINKDNYLSFLDNLNDKKFVNLMNNYQIALHDYLSFYDKVNEVTKKKNDLSGRLEYLLFEKNELEALDLTDNCDTILEQEINKLSNYDKIYQALQGSYYELNNENYSNDTLYDIKENLAKIKEFDQRYQDVYQLLNDAYFQIEEANSSLYKMKDELDFDPDYLNELNERLYKINKAKEKYHKSVSELIQYLEDITLDIELSENYDEALNKLHEDLKHKHQILVESALKLSDYRKKEALEVEKMIEKECLDLDLENTNFKIIFNDFDTSDYLNKNKFLNDGIDQIDFLISFNKGEPIKPLSKVASGGELSRVMLAFKIIYLHKNELCFMVFDEIDSGVSGITARKIGKKLKEISKQVQVMAITHLAQVASLADKHLFIEKVVVNNRTKTKVTLLDFEDRIKEIALMLSGSYLSNEMLASAKRMLEDEK